MNKITSLFLICIIAFISGCTYGEYVTPERINAANKLCENNNGVEYLLVYSSSTSRTSMIFYDEVRCNNGASFKNKYVASKKDSDERL